MPVSAQVLGMFGAYLFPAALAAYCEVAALAETGSLGLKLMAFVTLLIVEHGEQHNTSQAGSVQRLAALLPAIKQP